MTIRGHAPHTARPLLWSEGWQQLMRVRSFLQSTNVSRSPLPPCARAVPEAVSWCSQRRFALLLLFILTRGCFFPLVFRESERE